jgi:hypothetical protein
VSFEMFLVLIGCFVNEKSENVSNQKEFENEICGRGTPRNYLSLRDLSAE